MKRIIILLQCYIVSMSWTVSLTRECRYFVDDNLHIFAFENDRFSIYDYSVTTGYPPMYEIYDTLGVYNYEMISDGMYRITPVDSCFVDPFEGISSLMRADPQINRDSIRVRIHTPNMSYPLSIRLSDDHSLSVTGLNDYEIKIPKLLAHSCLDIMPTNLGVTSAFTSRGQYVGKLWFTSPQIIPDDTDLNEFESVDIYIPNINERTFDDWYIPNLVIKETDEALYMLGGKFVRIERFWE